MCVYIYIYIPTHRAYIGCDLLLHFATYAPTHRPIYLPAYLPAYPTRYLATDRRAILPNCFLACPFPACFLACLLARFEYIPTYLPTHILTYMHTRMNTTCICLFIWSALSARFVLGPLIPNLLQVHQSSENRQASTPEARSPPPAQGFPETSWPWASKPELSNPIPKSTDTTQNPKTFAPKGLGLQALIRAKPECQVRIEAGPVARLSGRSEINACHCLGLGFWARSGVYGLTCFFLGGTAI